MVKKHNGKTITVSSIIDVVGALATENLEGQIYFMDTNKAGGSVNQGTESLQSRVSKGNRLVWTVISLECEAYAAIDHIDIDKNICEPVKEFYEGTDVSYWVGTVKENVKDVSYGLSFKVGTRDEPFHMKPTLSLVG